MKRFDKLNLAHQNAANAIIEAVKLAFPRGTIIDISIHGARKIRAEVTAHSHSWWHDPGMVTVQNVKSLKPRRVNLAIIEDSAVEVIPPTN